MIGGICMKINHLIYDSEKSFERIDNIINESDSSFEELKEIPSRDKLTFTNGYYVNCTALFADIKDSSKLPKLHTRPKLAKLYRIFISELVAIINSNEYCSEINILGDCVSGVFNTPNQSDLNSLIDTAAKINSLINVLNYKFHKNNIKEIQIGIGISYGRALMIKAGFNGSGINDLVWMGDVLNEASNLCKKANELNSNNNIIISEVLYNNLTETKKKFFEDELFGDYYSANVIDSDMNEWYKNNCKDDTSYFNSFFEN
jgi:class 3 adenylate cyclase